jgi:FkbH-like protein
MSHELNMTQRDLRLSEMIRADRERFADMVAGAFQAIPRWQNEAEKVAGTRADFLALNFEVFADYVIRYFETADEVYRQLLLGEFVKALYVANASIQTARETAKQVMSDLQTRIEFDLGERLAPDARARLVEFIADIATTLTTEAQKVQKVLLVGDCLFLDIVPFIVGELLDLGIRFIPEYATSKNPSALRDELRAHGANKFDLVFFSPFTYEFSPEFSQLLDWKNSLKSDDEALGIVQIAWEEARTTVQLLADLFDCPIYVHNSAVVVREESRAKRVIKNRATARVRRLASERLNELLKNFIEQQNQQSFQHLYVFDELASVEQAGELEAGAYFHKTALQHPAVLGRLFSEEYVDLIYVNAWLMKRKVVVCDLDNTLWDGVIGEGDVKHYHDRQLALKAVKAKGVVLAINSKNDPNNVHWRGGTLSDDDFVCAAISWEPKVRGMQRIQDSLNLKIKDFVFIDDREDERELMRTTYPDVLCLDAMDVRVWHRIIFWEKVLQDDQDMDRTQMYKQRDARKAFIKEDITSPEERAALFSGLGLRVKIENAGSRDLKRVTELINRTNQFNLEGSRTTFKEVSTWHASADHVILLGHTSDRFGDMGTTCIAVARLDGSEARILPFVLSCRVFGYGIEFAVMNQLKRIAGQRGVARIIGRYLPTPVNSPCKDFLVESGFVRDGDQWVFDLANGPVTPEPAWLQVEV